MGANLLEFALVAAALVASPGPDSILIIRNALSSGRRAGALTVAGVQAGIAVHAAAAVAGLSALVAYSPAAFRALAFAGALYLAYIGGAIIAGGALAPAQTNAPQVPPRRAFWQGMLCNLLNPKVLVLFVALMPTFVNTARGNEPQQIIALVLALLAINIPFQCALVGLAAQFNRLLATPARARRVQWFLGLILIAFAIALFIQHVAAV